MLERKGCFMKARLSGKRDSLGKQSTDCMQMGRQLRGFFTVTPRASIIIFQIDCDASQNWAIFGGLIEA